MRVEQGLGLFGLGAVGFVVQGFTGFRALGILGALRKFTAFGFRAFGFKASEFWAEDPVGLRALEACTHKRVEGFGLGFRPYRF